MPSYAPSPAVLQQLRRAVAGALAELTSDGATVLGGRREVAALAVHIALDAASKAEAQIDSAPWIDIAMRLVLAVVQRYGGTVESFEASGVLAFFGVPYTHEDGWDALGWRCEPGGRPDDLVGWQDDLVSEQHLVGRPDDLVGWPNDLVGGQHLVKRERDLRYGARPVGEQH